MDKFKKIANVAVWIAAAVMALYLAVTDYIEKNPFPQDAPQTETSARF